MSDGLRIDYSGLHDMVDEAKVEAKRRKKRKKSLRALPLRMVKWLVVLVLLATLPFAVLIRGGVFAYQEWALGTWPAFGLAVAATALLLAIYAWALGRKLGAGKGMRWIMTRGAIGIAIAYAGYGLVYVASANVKTDEVRAEYARLHPLLRVSTSLLTLIDREAVITDASRTAADYFAMGLPVNEASLHFEQENGFVHALDLRTNGRPEWRNKAVELGFWALGFHSLRHVGTADHLHISLRLPE